MDDVKKKVIDGLERHMHGLCHDTKDNLCPYWSVETGCSKALISDTLTIIRSHEAEIKKLNKAIEEKQKHLENLEKVNKELEERIAIMSESDNDWHFFNFRPMTDEEKEYYELEDCKDEDAQMLENCPLDGEEVILWTPWGMSIDTYHWDVDGAYFEEHEEVEKGWAWKYPPKPPESPKEGEQ